MERHKTILTVGECKSDTREAWLQNQINRYIKYHRQNLLDDATQFLTELHHDSNLFPRSVDEWVR